MGVTYVKEVMSPEQLLSEYSLPEGHRKLKIERDKEIAEVFTGKSDKFLVIIGYVRQITKIPYATISTAL